MWLDTYCTVFHNNSNLSTIKLHNIIASNIVLHAVGVDRAAPLSGSTCSCNKESINDINNSNPVKLGVLQGSFFYLFFFCKPPFISDASEKPLCKVYSGALIVSSFIILYNVQTFSKHGDNIHCRTNFPKSIVLCWLGLFLSLLPIPRS
jgi:hypothetical protein